MAEYETQDSNALVPLILDNTINQFVKDILDGFRSIPKYLPSKYLYDSSSEALLRQLYNREEYYYDKCILEILKNESPRILDLFYKKGRFKLIDIGIEEHSSTNVLLSHFWAQNAKFDYIPISDSTHELQHLVVELWKDYPTLNIFPLVGDYTEILYDLKSDKTRKVIFFLSKNIGNYRFEEAVEIVQNLSSLLNDGDMVLIGFDLKKDPHTIKSAMNDQQGISKTISMNLLERINSTLSGNINPNNFIHTPIYDPETGEYKNFLVSTKNQNVRLALINEEVFFRAWETILLDTGKKYDEEEVYFLELCSGFSPKQYLYDKKHFVMLSIWEKNA